MNKVASQGSMNKYRARALEYVMLLAVLLTASVLGITLVGAALVTKIDAVSKVISAAGAI